MEGSKKRRDGWKEERMKTGRLGGCIRGYDWKEGKGKVTRGRSGGRNVDETRRIRGKSH